MISASSVLDMYLEKAQKDTVVLKSEKSAILGSHELFATKAFFEIFFAIGSYIEASN